MNIFNEDGTFNAEAIETALETLAARVGKAREDFEPNSFQRLCRDARAGSRNAIDELIERATIENEPQQIRLEDNPDDLKRFLIEIKVQTDRWALVLDTFYMSPSTFDTVVSELDLENKDGEAMLWGASIFPVENMVDDTVLGLATRDRHSLFVGELPIKDENKAVAVGYIR